MDCPYITKSGDRGKTSLMQTRLKKSNPAIAFIGSLDEINSYVGLIVSHLKYQEPTDNHNLTSLLLNIQNQLLNVGGCINGNIEITEQYHLWIEEQSNLFFQKIKLVNNFILPGGSVLSSYFHITRCIIRRSETLFWQYQDYKEIQMQEQSESETYVGKYINRLSDLFFILGRLCGQNDELIWKVGKIFYEQ